MTIGEQFLTFTNNIFKKHKNIILRKSLQGKATKLKYQNLQISLLNMQCGIQTKELYYVNKTIKYTIFTVFFINSQC